MNRRIVLCKCHGERISNDLISGLDSRLNEISFPVTRISDLCGCIQNNGNQVKQAFSGDEEVLLIGCYRRTMSLLLSQAGISHSRITYLNLIETGKDEALSQILDFTIDQSGHSDAREIIDDSGWPSWYPVIDYSRCTNCGQCADFCLFGVYERSDGRIIVSNAKGCKNNCPACARICPASAIIFPKYKNGGAVGGSDSFDEAGEHRRQVQDIENLLGSNIYDALLARKSKRESIIRNEAMKRAIEDRDKALNEMKEE